MPALTVLILLRKSADSPKLTGSYERRLPDGRLTVRYNYDVVRVWERSPEEFLRAGAAVAPLALLTNLSESELPRVFERAAEVINAAPAEEAGTLWTAAYVLMGLKYSREMSKALLKGVSRMQDSTKYQGILEDGRKEGWAKGWEEGHLKGVDEGKTEGRTEEALGLLLRLGAKRFRKPSASTLAALKRIGDPDRLESLCERLLDPSVESWSELLKT